MPQPLSLKPIGLPFIELQSVDSTNNYALAQVHAGLAQHGETVFAHEQLAGKGQRGRVWATEKGANIIMSIVINPSPLLLIQQFQLSACIAVAVREFFSQFGGDATSIKWPNDLYWQDRKAGGVLIESIVGGGGSDESLVVSRESGSARWEWSIVGIGVNINQTVFERLPNPVSLKQITGRDFDAVVLAKELCEIIDKYFRLLVSSGFEIIYQQYLAHLYKKNETVRLKKDSRVFEAIIKGVSTTGRLMVQHAMEEEFDFGEVEWVR